MGLMEIELAKLDYRERMDEAGRRMAADRRRASRVRGRGYAKIDSPVFSLQLGRFRYRLWFTRTVCL